MFVEIQVHTGVHPESVALNLRKAVMICTWAGPTRPAGGPGTFQVDPTRAAGAPWSLSLRRFQVSLSGYSSKFQL